ncbi:MAG: hypothetical protein U0T83_04575 [Bacteriovoracaceae bacterium]
MLDKNKHDKLVYELTINLIKIISETNGISIADTLELSSHSMLMRMTSTAKNWLPSLEAYYLIFNRISLKLIHC